MIHGSVVVAAETQGVSIDLGDLSSAEGISQEREALSVEMVDEGRTGVAKYCRFGWFLDGGAHCRLYSKILGRYSLQSVIAIRAEQWLIGVNYYLIVPSLQSYDRSTVPVSWSSPRVAIRSTVLVAEYQPGATFGPRTLQDYELVWLLSGSATWQLDHRINDEWVSETHRLRPGTITLAQTGQRDRYQWDSRHRSQHAYVHFSVEDPGGLPAENDWPAVRSVAESSALAGLTNYLIELSTVPTSAARCRSDQVVSFLLDVFVSGPFLRGVRSIPSDLEHVFSYVASVWEADGMRIITADELADATQLSRRRLLRLFQQEYQIGPARVLEMVRLSRGAVLLQRSNETIASVSELTGFANPYHFSRRFTHTYGSPPGAFRAVKDQPDPMGPMRGYGLHQLIQRFSGTIPIN